MNWEDWKLQLERALELEHWSTLDVLAVDWRHVKQEMFRTGMSVEEAVENLKEIHDV